MYYHHSEKRRERQGQRRASGLHALEFLLFRTHGRVFVFGFMFGSVPSWMGRHRYSGCVLCSVAIRLCSKSGSLEINIRSIRMRSMRIDWCLIWPDITGIIWCGIVQIC